MANWSELLPDLLEIITSYLSLIDLNRFSAVCKQWRLVAKQQRYAPAPQLPWVVLNEDPETGKRKMFNMSERRHYYFDIPKLRGGYCVGSSFGWLFIVSPKIEGYLVNPFTGAYYCFPPLPLYIKYLNLDQVVDGKTTYEKDGRSYTWKLKKLQKLTIAKAVLSDDPNKCKEFITIIMVRGLNKMAFCRPKDSTWTIVPGLPVSDVICYKGNFYAIGGLNALYKVDLGPEPKLQMINPWVKKYLTGECRYLVDYFGKHLLLVYRDKVLEDDSDYDTDGEQDEFDETIGEDNLDTDVDTVDQQSDDSDDDCSPFHFVTDFFAVLELDLEKEEWHEWDDLKGNALFVGTNRALALRASEFPDCKADCIYFTSSHTDVLVSNDYGFDDLGVYNLIEDSIEKLYEDHIPNTSMPTWLVPNP